MTTEQEYLDPLEEWISFDEAYRAFVDAHPMLGLGRNDWAAQNVRRNFSDKLAAVGAARQLVNRRWLAHRTKFGPALFALLVRGPTKIGTQATQRRVNQILDEAEENQSTQT